MDIFFNDVIVFQMMALGFHLEQFQAAWLFYSENHQFISMHACQIGRVVNQLEEMEYYVLSLAAAKPR